MNMDKPEEFNAELVKFIEGLRCSLLVLENISKNGIEPKCIVRNYFQSESFTREFGTLKWENELGHLYGRLLKIIISEDD